MSDFPAFKIVSAMRRLTLARHELKVWSNGTVDISIGGDEAALAWFTKHYPPIAGRVARLVEHGRRPAKRGRRSTPTSHGRPARPAAPDTWSWTSAGVTVRYLQPHRCGPWRSESGQLMVGERPSWWCIWCGGELGIAKARERGLIP